MVVKFLKSLLFLPILCVITIGFLLDFKLCLCLIGVFVVFWFNAMKHLAMEGWQSQVYCDALEKRRAQ